MIFSKKLVNVGALKEQVLIGEEKKMIELKPCPFCGGKATLDIARHGGSQYDYAEISCKKCGLTIRRNIDVEYSAKDEVIKAWNKREKE